MLGVAVGMEYLHTMKPTVIHGDLRAVYYHVIMKHMLSLTPITAKYPD